MSDHGECTGIPVMRDIFMLCGYKPANNTVCDWAISVLYYFMILWAR